MSTNISKTSIKCAVFDLDGTLLNTIKTITHYLNVTLKSFGLSTVSEADAMSFVGDGAVKLIERTLRHVGADDVLFDSVYKAYNESYNASPYYLTEPYDGIIELLSTLKSEGIRLAVLSNKPDFAVRAAVEHFLPNTFDVVRGGRDGVPLKPCPDALFDILRELSVTSEQTAYIGDSEPDVMIARNSGVALPIFVTYGFRTAECLRSVGAENLADTPRAINSILSNF